MRFGGLVRRVAVLFGLVASLLGVSAALEGSASVYAVSSCGTGSSSYKYSTTLLFVTVDVFKHNITNQGCGDASRNVVTSVDSVKNDCSKYAWDVAYLLKAGYGRTTVNVASVTGTSTCRVRIGGTIGGVGLEYSKQSNSTHRYYWSGSTLMVARGHHTSTP